MVKGLMPGLAELGKIKIGKKGATITSTTGKEFRPPEKLDHFVITTTERTEDGDFAPDKDLMKKIKALPGAHCNADGELVSIPVRLMYNDVDLNFPTRYAAYEGRNLSCTGDGEKAVTCSGRETTCPCDRLKLTYSGSDKCKINGILSVLIDGMDTIGGCYKFRTTSANTCKAIIGSLELIRLATGGLVAWLPLNLEMRPKTTTIPGTGKSTTVYVVSLSFRGDIATLRKTALDMAAEQRQYLLSMQDIEQAARKTSDFASENTDDVVEEFYPDNISSSGPDSVPGEADIGKGEKTDAPETSFDDALGGEKSAQGTPPGEPEEKEKATHTSHDKPETEPDQSGTSASTDQHSDATGLPVPGEPDIPFGGKQKALVDCFKDLLSGDVSLWQKALLGLDINIPDGEVQNVCKSDKYADRDTWIAIIGNYLDDRHVPEQVYRVIDISLSAIRRQGGKEKWITTLKQFGCQSAKDLNTGNVDSFLEKVRDDIPF